jgi:hypothetical protein
VNELLQKFCPDVLERHELPNWFVRMADSRSKGRLAFIVWDRMYPEDIIHADFYINDEYFETKTFGIKLKK